MTASRWLLDSETQLQEGQPIEWRLSDLGLEIGVLPLVRLSWRQRWLLELRAHRAIRLGGAKSIKDSDLPPE